MNIRLSENVERSLKPCMNKILLLVFLYFGLFGVGVYAQCPTATFPDTVCAGQSFDITNTTPGFQSYLWDFCMGDLNNPPAANNIGNPGGLNQPYQIDIVEDSGNYYGFFVNITNSVVRYDFGNSPANIPVAVSLGPFTLLNGSTGIQMVKENNNWYALVANHWTGEILRLDFGTDITNTSPTETLVGTFGFNSVYHIKVQYQNNNLLLFAAGFISNTVGVINFGNSINNPPVSTSITHPSFNHPASIAIAYDCITDKFIGFAGNYSGTTLSRFDFGNSLTNTPAITELTGLPISQATSMSLIREGQDWHLIITDQSNIYTHLNFGTSLLNTPSVLLSSAIGSMNYPRGMQFVNYNSTWYGIILNWGNSITTIEYPNTCYSNISVADVANPNGIIFTTAGSYVVQLEAKDTDNHSHYFNDTIIVLEAPESNFIYTNQTCDNTFEFFDQSIASAGSITNWDWDFGDGNSATTQNPTHSFQTPGSFIVQLTVTDSYGCTNTSQQTIFNQLPVASFVVNDGCVVPPLDFINTSPDSQNVITSWFWEFGDADTSSIKSPNHIYSTPGTYNVTLIASIGACSDTFSLAVTYEPKPDLSFEVENTCITQQHQFINYTSIASGNITSYLWEFGDGNTSTNINPLHQYADTGTYPVKLIATGSNGCIDSLIQPVRISIAPAANFNISPAVLCTGNQVNFQDISVGFGDTISNWLWNFNTGDTSVLQHSAYIFSNSGQYNVTLYVTTGTHCVDSISQQVIVEESPVASFTASSVCLGDTTYFTDLSSTPTGSTLISWNWHFLPGDSSILQNPQFLFPAHGDFQVILTVTSDIGCSSSDTMSINISPLPESDFTTQNMCSNKLTQFTDLTTIATGNIISWSWDFGDPSSGISNLSTDPNPVHKYDVPGNYNVQLITISDNGCVDTLIQSIEVKKTPAANFSASQACDGEHVLFTYLDNSFPSNATNWYWNFGNGATSNIEDPANLYLTWGTYNVTLIVADTISNCSDTIVKAIEVDPIPVPVINNYAACLDASYTLMDSSYVAAGTIQNWEWTVEGEVYNIQNPQHIFSDTGMYLVTLEVTSNKGCTAIMNDSLYVSGLPDADFIFFPTYGNAPLLVNFINNSVNSTAANWLFGDGNISTDYSPTHLFTDTGNFTITLVAINEYGCKDSLPKSLYIINPILDIAILDLNYMEQNGYINVSVELFNFGTREINSFIISSRLGGKPAIQENWSGSIKSGESMLYNFQASLEMIDELNFICASVIAPNGEKDQNPVNNDFCKSITSEFEFLSVFPNPTNDFLTVQFNITKTEPVKIELIDSKGSVARTLFAGTVFKGFNSLNFSLKQENISLGIYNIRITSTDAVIFNKLTVY